MPHAIEADYVIIGAGQAGMAFADTLVRNSTATVAIVDRHARPGGHWNEAYPFISIHLPSHFYGVDALALGDDTPCVGGPNDGLCHMATGTEVLDHFGRCMERVLLASGRVTYHPMTEVEAAGDAVSRLTGVRRRIVARKKRVDATFSRTAVPSQGSRRYSVAAGVDCVPIRDLPMQARTYDHYCIVGSGKTGVDACLWLLAQGVETERMRWIMPRVAWWINRAKQQWTAETFDDWTGFIITQMEALARADTVDDVFLALEREGYVFRGVPGMLPTMYHATTVAPGEVPLLHGIRDVIRKGRLRAIEADALVFDEGRVPAKPNTLYVDCSANGITVQPGRPIFSDGAITLQLVRLLKPPLSGAMLGLIEATMSDDASKNALCQPVSICRVPDDLLRMMATSAANTAAWNKVPHLSAFLRATRLDSIPRLLAQVDPADVSRQARIEGMKSATMAGMARLPTLLDRLGSQIMPPR